MINKTTALRTAATSVMVAKRLARPDSRSMALIGNGSQSEFQALAFIALLGVADGGAFHWRFHGAWPAAGADIQFAQAKLGTDAARVQVLIFINRVAAPADNHIRRFADVKRAGVTQNREHQVGDVN